MFKANIKEQNFLKGKNKFNLQFFLLFSGIVIAILGQYFLFYKINLILGLLMFFIAVIFFTSFNENLFEKKKTKEIFNKEAEIFLFAVIFLTGIFFRVYDFGNTPPGFFSDEVNASRDAIKILRGDNVTLQNTSLPIYIKGDIDNPALVLYPVIVFLKFFGIGIVQLRFAAATLHGILSIMALYFLLRNIFNIKYALVGMFLFSVMRWHITYSRIFFHASICVFILILFLYFFYKAIKYRKTFDFILAGLSLGLTQHTYHPIKLILIWIFLIFIFLIFKEKNFIKYNLKKIIIFFAFFFMMFLPLFIHIINDHKNYTIRIQKLSIFNKNNSENWIDGTYSLQRIILNNTVKTLLMFNYQGDGNPRHNYRQKPMLDFVSGILFVLGFGLAIRRILKLEIFFFLSLFLIGILGSILYVAAPHATRTIIILPSIIVFCILSLQKIERCLILYKKNIFNFLICIILILVGVLNYNNYFNGYAKDFDLYDAFHSSRVDAAKYVVSLGNDWRCISAIEFCRQYIVSFAFQFIMEINNKNNYECFDVNKHIPVIPEYDKNYLFLFPMGYESIVNLLKKLYPNGIYKTFYKKNNERYISFFTYEIDKKDIKNPMIKNIKNGLTAYYYKNQNWIGEIMKKKQYFIWVHNDPAKNTGILSIKWVGKIKIDKSGEYVFVGESEDDVYWEIIINGKIIGTSPIRKGKVFDRINVYLDKGMQNFEIRCSSFRDIQKMKMFWIPANQNEPPVIIPNEVLFF